MKIALLSFHNAANYGAALQAYALEKFLLEQGIDCEYIDYVNKGRKNAYSMSYHIISNLKKRNIVGAIKYAIGSPFMLLRKFRFSKFYKKNLKCTSQRYSNAEQIKVLNHIYDKFIVGSDQVWNMHNNGGDYVFLLNFVQDNSRKIAYSSSFGLAEIPHAERDSYAKYLSEIRHIAVRESFGANMVRELTGRQAKLVLDPVFLLTKEQWESIAPHKSICEKFIFYYTNKNGQEAEFLKQTGYKVSGRKQFKLSRNITPRDFIDSSVRVKYTMAPEEFIRVIRDAELVVSASFHCISLAIILNKPFVAILTGDRGKDERILNILHLLGLKDRILSCKMRELDVEKKIDYKRVNAQIKELVKDSTEFLLNAIKSN